MGVWQAMDRVHVANIYMEPGDRIHLTEEWEKELLLGKYRRAPKGNEKPGPDGKVGNSWLRQVSKEKLSEDHPEAPDGFIYYPLDRNTMPKEYADVGLAGRPSVNRNGTRF